MVFHEENRYRCARSCTSPPLASRNRMKFVALHSESGSTAVFSANQRTASSSTAMPAPRASRVAGARSSTVTSQPASVSTSAAVRPPSEPPTTATLGMPGTTGSGPAEGRDPVHLQLEEHPALVDGRVTEPVRRRVAGVLGPDPVQLRGDPGTLLRVVLGDLPFDGGFDGHPVVGVPRVDQREGGPRL